MINVFISGSRSINKLNKDIKCRLDNIVEQQYQVLVGDANGADKAVQDYLAAQGYSKVMVYCSGNNCRNNTGLWEIVNVEVDVSLKGRDYYTQKDKAMADKANYGFVLWDGKSSGSINNVLELLKRGKKSLLYYFPDSKYYTICTVQDFQELLSYCDQNSFKTISKKVKLKTSIKEIETTSQGSFSF